MMDYNNTAKLLTVLIAINTVIFLILSSLHFYWAFGGTLWYEDVLPTNSTGSKRMNPSVMATLIVAFGILLLVFVTLGNQGIWDGHIKGKYFRYGALLISITFFIRALGDFKFIGFFKTVKGTKFAINDIRFFSPLCVFIAVISLLIFMFNKSEP